MVMVVALPEQPLYLDGGGAEKTGTWRRSKVASGRRSRAGMGEHLLGVNVMSSQVPAYMLRQSSTDTVASEFV